jgi:hypothetical protein
MKKRRILRIWYYGYLPLAKKIRKRIIIEALYEHIKGREHASIINPMIFQDAANANQSHYWDRLSQSQAND